MTQGSVHPGKIVAIVQARMGSRRLPGKMMMDLCGHPVLHWVLSRVRRAGRIDQTFLATSTSPRDDPLVELAQRQGVAVYRGSEEDVLGRFSAAAREFGADTIVRVCADNPLIAPEEVDRLVATYCHWVEEGRDAMRLYAFNHIPSERGGYPDGLGAEIASARLLHSITQIASVRAHREHVFDYITDNAPSFDIRAVTAPAEIRAPDIKLDLDTPEDLAFLRVLCAELHIESDAVSIVRAARTLEVRAGR